ncbi:unnamed protein product [Calypogeia fissa]
MMEGGGNQKNMARSKRASSQRSKAKHSKHRAHGASGTAAATRERTVSEDSLPSNWERYGDESGSDEDLPPLAEGEVRPKSKGADYRELLSSDVPQLFEEAPEMEGMTAMLLANGLGLWDWDSSYLEPASLSAERQAAREASALLTLDLRLLGKSLGRLNLAQRLFLEDECFPEPGEQCQVEDKVQIVGSPTRMSVLEDAGAPMKDAHVQEQDDLILDTSASSGNALLNRESPSSALASDNASFNRQSLNFQGERVSSVTADTAHLVSTGAKAPSANTGDSVINYAPTVSKVWERNIDAQGQMGVEISKEATKVKTFEAAAAEAELDDLLDMLDNQVASISLKKDTPAVNLPRRSVSENRPFNPSYPASSRGSNNFQESRVEPRLTEVTQESPLGPTPKHTGQPAYRAKQLEKNDSSSHAKAADVVLAQDDDFDLWLDSI